MSSQVENLETVVAADEASILSATPPTRRRASKAVIGIAVFIVIAAGIGRYLYSRGIENTDDAQVDGHLIPIASRVDGNIQAVHVEDNQIVKTGALLVELDPRDYQVAFNQAKAQYDQAAAQLVGADPNLPITRIANESDLTSGTAEVAAAEATLEAARQDLAASVAKQRESEAVNERAQANFQRYQTLLDKNEVSRADYDQFKSTAVAQVQTVAANQAGVKSAEKTVDQRLAQLEQQKSRLQQSRSSAPLKLAIREADIKSQRANSEATKAALDKARLNLNYGSIVAPVPGVVTQRSAEPGSRISTGQQLLMIVETDDLWVTANFKETQLARMHPGQRVKVYVDAMREDFDATVESMSAITGSRTSVLPPENATGNYVKVIQRMPVRIRFNSGQKDLDKLRPGMSVEPKVYVE
jgi:membrane fusion protein (multidrug efflux system)